MNIFEGARRITHVAAVIALAIGVISGADKMSDFFPRFGMAMMWIVGIYVFSVAMGWIVRGFAAIPTKSDHRPK